MQRDSDRQGEEDAWRAIVENYGERVELDPPEAEAEVASVLPFQAVEDYADPPAASLPASAPVDQDPEDRFVPPTPPPMPAVPRDRLAAWIGLFGSPAVLLVCLVAGVTLPGYLAYLLVAGFVGGFIYLVVTMPSGPADPWDDGARL